MLWKEEIWVFFHHRMCVWATSAVAISTFLIASQRVEPIALAAAQCSTEPVYLFNGKTLLFHSQLTHGSFLVYGLYIRIKPLLLTITSSIYDIRLLMMVIISDWWSFINKGSVIQALFSYAYSQSNLKASLFDKESVYALCLLLSREN